AWMNLSGFWIINPRGRSSQSLRAFAQSIYSYNTTLVDASSTLRWILMDEEETHQFDRIIQGQGVFDPDTSLVYTIKPAKMDVRLKAYVTNNVHLVNLREDDQRQKWKLQAVESQEEGAKRYYLYNLGAQKCLTIQKWIGEETSTAQALRNTKMLAKDPENIHQQLSLKSVEVDFSGEVPVRYITIENDHPVMLDTVLDERAFRLEVLNETVNSQVGNRFDVDGVRDTQRWILIADQVQTALPEASVAKADLFYRDGLLHYRLPENSTLEVFTLTGQLVAKTQAGMDEGELELDKGIYMVRVRQQQGTEVFKILAH
ncbi:MAG TPA: T9SS type A sorting domain-containing protein, partial [Bacteroidales bacterium]|nr:T9SS type A sorting domain-containing protein [Bacteroidales bacterium]